MTGLYSEVGFQRFYLNLNNQIQEKNKQKCYGGVIHFTSNAVFNRKCIQYKRILNHFDNGTRFYKHIVIQI